MIKLKFDPGNLIIIGSSTGGPITLESILKNMPVLDAAIIIVQHLPSHSVIPFCEHISEQTEMEVRIVVNGEDLKSGKIYITPAEYHLTIKNSFKLLINHGEKVNFVCPSIDVTMLSLEKNSQQKKVGIILTGMGRDGSNGLLHMRQIGAITIAQNLSTCAIKSMPSSAISNGSASLVLKPQEIHEFLETFSHKQMA